MTAVHVICSVLNGERFLPEFFDGMRAQSHADWHLWVRDDGSNDRTATGVATASGRDERIQLLPSSGDRLGVGGGFGWVLERVPADASYVMCADADDVWLPRKIERTLAAMQASEASARGPVLVHTDLVVTDAELRTLHRSFWEYAGINPEPAPLRRIVVENVVTAPTVMINRALRELIGATPPTAPLQDWWYACVAAAFGRIVAVHDATVLYRQHSANAVGARRRATLQLHDLPGAMRGAIERTGQFRHDLAISARQAGTLLARYGGALQEADREFLAAYSRIPDQKFFARKLAVLRWRVRPEHGLLRNLAAVLRA